MGPEWYQDRRGDRDWSESGTEEFMANRRPEAPPEAADFLAANPEIRAVELLLPDLNGILRGTRVSRRELAGW